MKIYVVTRGSYSDYSIDKIFIDKDKAKEYREWVCGYDDTVDIEEYDTTDDLQYTKYYCISIMYDEYQNGSFMPNVNVYKTTDDGANRIDYSERYDSRGNYVRINMYRCVPAANYERNPEFYVNKYKKAAYDYAAIAKQKRREGASEYDVRRMFCELSVKNDVNEEV